MSNSRHLFVIGGCAVVAAGAFLVAGPLNPPTGPVSAGGKTTQEIYDAVTNISGSIGTVGGRGPAVPGVNRSAGTVSVGGPSGLSFSGPILGLRFGVKSVSGGPSASVTADTCTIVREVGDGSAKAFRLVVIHAVGSVTVVVPSAGGNTTYVFSDAEYTAVRDYNIQRADGSFASVEEFDLTVHNITVTDPSGASYSYSPHG